LGAEGCPRRKLRVQLGLRGRFRVLVVQHQDDARWVSWVHRKSVAKEQLTACEGSLRVSRYGTTRISDDSR